MIDSFATSREEIGNPPHRGTVNKLREVGIPLVPHRAKQISLADYDKFDYIIGMLLVLSLSVPTAAAETTGGKGVQVSFIRRIRKRYSGSVVYR